MSVSDDEWIDEDAIARAIGYVAMESSRLERLTGVLALHLLGSDLGEVAVLGQAWGTVHQICRSLVAERQARGHRIGGRGCTQTLEEVAKVLDSASELMTRRNHVLHGYWLADEDADEIGLVLLVDRRYGGQRIMKRESLANVTSLSEQLETVADEIGRLASDLGGTWSP